MDSKTLIKLVAEDEREIVDALCSMLRIKAIGPESGGSGEAERGRFLVKLVRDMGFESVQVYESDDPSVPGGKRPNIFVRVKGRTDRNIWVVTHMDTVPEGDLSAWKSPPYEPRIEDGRIYARGVEDNGQELIASLFGLRALLKAGIVPEFNAGLVFVSDEEHGNVHGIDFLLNKGLFRKDDLIIVPDHGHPDGAAIEIVEKGIAWVEVEVIGQQTHGSTPHKGVNAFEVAARYMVAAVDMLRRKYCARDELFDPPVSTFEPTKCDANGPNINTVPGRQTFSFDFRVLPEYSLDDVMADLQSLAKEHERSTRAKINLRFVQKAPSAAKTDPNSDIVRRLKAAIKQVRGIDAYLIGIGGGTCANPFRREGIDAVVWSTVRETAHDANEYSVIADIVADAQVYAVLFAGASVSHN